MPEPARLISSRALAERAGDAGLCIMDCRFDLAAPARGSVLFNEGHIPGAVHADLDRDLAGPVGPRTGRHPLPAPGALAATLGGWGIDNGTDVVVYDAANSAFAARAWWLLRWLGHDRVAVLDGGLAAWQEAELPLETGPARPRVPRRFVTNVRPERVVGTAEIARRVAAGEPGPLVDARDGARFRGEAEPIDTVAGHIPGALNFPLARSLEADGRFRPAPVLAREWRNLLGDGVTGPWTVMCGSGVTACHLALSASLAGHAEPAVYVGSWSEWIRDPARPVATGT